MYTEVETFVTIHQISMEQKFQPLACKTTIK